MRDKKVELKIFHLPDENEYEYKYRGNYGAKGEKRAKRSKITIESQQKRNQRNKEKEVRRTIKLNFRKDDLWVTLKYPAGKRKPIKEIQKDRASFLRKLRDRFKETGNVFKFIYRMEVSSKGGVHMHFIINNVPGQDVTGWIRDAWDSRYVEFRYLYEEGGFEDLAAYLVKPAESDTGQMYFAGMGMEDKKAFMRYGSSRNLKRPVPEVRQYSHWTMRHFMSGNEPKPSEGFYIDKSSIRQGINPFTGYSYLYYTERRLFSERDKDLHLDRCEPVPRGPVLSQVRAAGSSPQFPDSL
ncbi:MAG: hypothetical protein IKD59_09185 [Lachnospiraceae bacterium]|nr:hypothetical protein [Lachnospiraceae bacterium]MBR3374213.1 hypothetical protein [Bacillota bacterium]